jgi:hypothetical protein
MDIGALINNQYRVIEHIGRGGMADVWSARDQRLRRMVAIKTIAAGLSADVDPVALFEKEAQTIAQMEHPHILPIYDFGEYDNSLYIVMRYVTGGSLEGELQNGAMEIDEVMRMGDAVAKALDYAHSNAVIHLDLKPPNILLDSGGSPYLADFGLATVLDKQGRARNPGSGTLLYMAPEQLTSDTIDHRADIYAFCIMLFHMMTGQLPFEGRVPLAMRQIQAGDTLPYVDEINELLPHDVNVVLRKGTEQDPFNRYATHNEVMKALRQILQPNATWTATTPIPNFELESYMMETQKVETDDAGLLEAVDLYSRARYSWQGGQGRFLLGVTHFMLMSGYYQDAAHYGLTIDHEGYQMLLRGAIEYDYELDYWWKQVNDADRRWVCLHALRSGNAPARIRSLYRLETLPDDDNNPVIPRLVAQALEIEQDNTAKHAALRVLGTRSKLVKRPTMSIKTEFRGRLLTSFTRMGIQIAETGQWQEAIYSPEVDTLVAEQAFDENPDVAEFAARTVGRMRSLAGVAHLAQAQVEGRHGALDALAFVRDEAPALPDIVSPQARFYAWITNTIHRLTHDPLEGILRVVLALLGGWIAMGELVYNVFRSEQLFTAQRWGNTIAVGLVFGLFIAITYLVTDEMSRRLKGFWSWWQRLLAFGLLGILMGTLSFGGFTWMYYQYTPQWDMMRMGGIALAFALILSGLLELRGWQGVILTTILTFAPILVTHNAWYASQESTVVFVAPLALLIGLFTGWRAAHLSPVDTRLQMPGNMLVKSFVSLVVGAVWALAIWSYFSSVHQGILTDNPMTWDNVSWLFLGMFMFGLIAAYWLARPIHITLLAIAAFAVFGTLYAYNAWQFFDYSFTVPISSLEPAAEMVYYSGVPLSPVAQQPIFHFDDISNIYTVALPMVFVIALGMNLQPLVAGLWHWIGTPQSIKMRGGWLTGMLLYILTVTGLSSVLAIFSAKVDVLWALGWSVGAFITFVFALATYRWARWGAYGLIGSAVAFIFGGFFFDAVNMRYHASLGRTPELLRTFLLQINLGFGSDSAFYRFIETLSTIRFYTIATLLVLIGLSIWVWRSRERRSWGWFAFLGIAAILWLLPFLLIFEMFQLNIDVSVLTLWALWSVGIGVLTWGALRQRLWAGIGLIATLVGWYVVAIFSPIQGSMTVFAMTNVALLLYVLAPEMAGMEAGRFTMPRLSLNVQAPTKPKRTDEAPKVQPISSTKVGAGVPAAKSTKPNRVKTPSTEEFETTVNVQDDTELVPHESNLTDAQTEELNRLLAQSDVNAAGFDFGDDEDSEEVYTGDTVLDVDELNRLLAQSDVNAAGFDFSDDEDEPLGSDTVLDVEELNRLLAQSDVNAAGFDFGDDEDSGEISDSQLRTAIMFPRENPLGGRVSTEPVNIVEDSTNLPTELDPGGFALSDSDKLTTENLPKIKQSEPDSSEGNLTSNDDNS